MKNYQGLALLALVFAATVGGFNLGHVVARKNCLTNHAERDITLGSVSNVDRWVVSTNRGETASDGWVDVGGPLTNGPVVIFGHMDASDIDAWSIRFTPRGEWWLQTNGVKVRLHCLDGIDPTNFWPDRNP